MDKFSCLTMFVASAEQRSFSRAAEMLGKTPSAIAKAIAQLENELGARLFERTTRSMSLTEAGLIYLESARDALRGLHEAAEEIGQLQDCVAGLLRITAPLAFGPAFLNQACAEFLGRHPQLRLRIDLSDAYVDLLDGRYDLALREGNSELPGLIARPVGDNRIVLCASPAYLAARGEPASPAAIAGHECLIYRHAALDDHWWLERDGQRFAVRPKGRLESDNHELLLASCLDGHGLMPCPLWSVQPHLDSGRLRTVLDDYNFDPDAFGSRILAVYPSNRRATRKISAFIEYLSAFMNEHAIG